MTDLLWRPLVRISLTAQLKPSRIIEVELDDPENTFTEIMVAALATP